ncbi:MAG: BMP family ABC transporter substrate-binding protein [Treponema sp.]|jgi:simple sugar transport system substrate-binding protein|nr:BMP family ABC transporter substrate-binding protein [Treponema sp.]
MKQKNFCLALAAAVLLLPACTEKETPKIPGKTHIGVFIPGVMSGSPIYEMLAQGVRQGAADFSSPEDVEVTVVEGGYNQAEWEAKITAMAASGSYDLIVSSNPSMPAIAASVSQGFPSQRFLLLNGELAGHPRIFTLAYNQWEQAYMAGHIAALVTLEAAPGGARRVGLVAGQEYPDMTGVIAPGYLAGAQAADADFSLVFRVVGNWFDAGKGAELAHEMIGQGVSVILCVAGGANEGVVQAASEAGAKVVWFDINGYGVRPGTVVGSAVLAQEKAAREQTRRFLEGTLPFGSAEILGAAQGYVDFVEDDPRYHAAVSEDVREKQALLTARFRAGTGPEK